MFGAPKIAALLPVGSVECGTFMKVAGPTNGPIFWGGTMPILPMVFRLNDDFDGHDQDPPGKFHRAASPISAIRAAWAACSASVIRGASGLGRGGARY